MKVIELFTDFGAGEGIRTLDPNLGKVLHRLGAPAAPQRKPSAKIGAHQLPRGEVVGANDLRDPSDAGTCDHRRPFVRWD